MNFQYQFIKMAMMDECRDLEGKYRVLSVLSKKEGSAVYLTEHSAINTKRIIKKVSKNSLYRESLLREASVLKILDNQHIPAIYDIEETRDSIYMVEEYIPGETLYEYVKKTGILTEEKALDIGIKLAEIIEYIHCKNSFKVCHLDIQPKNIIINRNDVYLIDFGNSVTGAEDCSGDRTMATEGFAPPEQYQPCMKEKIEDSERADIFSFGAVMLYMLTGSAEFSEKIERHLCEKGISKQITKMIADAMNSNPVFRQQGIDVIVKQLKMICKQSEVPECDKTQGQKDELISDRKPYVVSVAGAKRGAGSTFAALALTNLLNKAGCPAYYQENNDSNMVRTMARLNKDISFDKGCFYWNGCKMKPDYPENIVIHMDEAVAVRDEGVIETDGQYGHMLLIVMSGGELGIPEICSVNSFLENYKEAKDKVLFGMFNRCSENAYKTGAGRLSIAAFRCGYGDNPFGNQEGMKPIAQKIMELVREREENYIKKNEKRKRQHT